MIQPLGLSWKTFVSAGVVDGLGRVLKESMPSFDKTLARSLQT